MLGRAAYKMQLFSKIFLTIMSDQLSEHLLDGRTMAVDESSEVSFSI